MEESKSNNQLMNISDQKYLKAREKAYQLETELEESEKQYKKQLSEIIRKMQIKFYQNYGKKIQQLDELEDAIQTYKSRGIKDLKKQLNNIYIEHLMEGGGGLEIDDDKKYIEDKAKILLDTYKQKFNPDDNYQKKRDIEAQKLKNAILGGTGLNYPKKNLQIDYN